MLIKRNVNGEEHVFMLTEDEVALAAREFVVDWMEESLMTFNVPEDECHEWAERAYDIYCDSDCLTEFEAVQNAYHEYEEEKGIKNA